MHFADQVTDGAGASARPELAFAKIEKTVGGAAIAHLVVQAGQHDIVALADRAVFLDEYLRHDEQ